MSFQKSLPFVALFLIKTALAQSLIKSRVINSRQEAVSSATIRLGSTGKGTHADAEGNFRLSVLPTDTLFISSVGYAPKMVLASDLAKEIQVKEVVLPIPELAVGAKRLKAEKVVLGNFRNNQNGQFQGYKEAVLYIDNPRKVPARITQVMLMTSRVRFDHSSPNRLKNHKVLFRLHLYGRHPVHGTPAQDLIKTDIIHHFKRKQRRIKLSFEDYAYLLPAEGAFLGIEFLGIYKGEEFVSFENTSADERAQFCLAISDGHAKAQSYIRQQFHHRFKAITIGQPYYNFNLGVEVLY